MIDFIQSFRPSMGYLSKIRFSFSARVSQLAILTYPSLLSYSILENVFFEAYPHY